MTQAKTIRLHIMLGEFLLYSKYLKYDKCKKKKHALINSDILPEILNSSICKISLIPGLDYMILDIYAYISYKVILSDVNLYNSVFHFIFIYSNSMNTKLTPSDFSVQGFRISR